MCCIGRKEIHIYDYWRLYYWLEKICICMMDQQYIMNACVHCSCFWLLAWSWIQSKYFYLKVIKSFKSALWISSMNTSCSHSPTPQVAFSSLDGSPTSQVPTNPHITDGSRKNIRHTLLALEIATYNIIYYFEPFSASYVLEKCNTELKDSSGKDPSRWSIGLKVQ